MQQGRNGQLLAVSLGSQRSSRSLWPSCALLLLFSLQLLQPCIFLAAAVGAAASAKAGGPNLTDGEDGADLLQGVRPASARMPLELPGNPDELLRCINENQPSRKTTTWESAIHDLPSRYEVIGLWWSNKTSNQPLTIATQLSYSRKWQLKAMCQSWPGPISAVMHMPTIRLPTSMVPDATRADLDALLQARKQKAAEQMAAVHRRLDSRLRCKLDLMLVHEQYGDERSLLLYPVNVLRNYARLQARTPLVGLIDVDVLLSHSLSQELRDPRRAAQYVMEATREKKIWVLPAFITHGDNLWEEMRLAEKLVRSSKDELLPLFKKNIIERFDPGSNGHQPTQYSKWFSTHKPYTVSWAQRYEPWVFSERGRVPWADVRFRGYGKNKIIILQALNYSGYQFIVHPKAFLVHRSHVGSSVKSLHNLEHSQARASGQAHAARNTLFGHNAWLNSVVEGAMRNRTYVPKVDAATRACLRELSWWQVSVEWGGTDSVEDAVDQEPVPSESASSQTRQLLSGDGVALRPQRHQPWQQVHGADDPTSTSREARGWKPAEGAP